MSDYEIKRIKEVVRIAASLLAVIFLFIIVIMSVYKVAEDEEAVVLTFGKYSKTQTAGLYIKAPFGIQTVYKVPANRILSFPIGFEQEFNSTVESEAKMITGDFNIVLVDFIVEYKVTDSREYLFAAKEPVQILKSLVQSAIKSAVSDYTIDDVLTTEKSAIQNQIKSSVQEDLLNYRIGLALADIKMQDSEVPSARVIYEGEEMSVSQAFDMVENARQNANQVLNEARGYESKNVAQAKSDADKITQDATAFAVERQNEALRQVNLFNAKFEDYQQNPEIARTRMFYEVLDKTLTKAKLYIDTTDGSSLSSLPIISELRGIN